jgi:FtsH-binding integral membrane protein
MTIANLDHCQQKIADAKSNVRSRLGQLGDETLHRVALWVGGGLVAGGAVIAAGHVGSEQHTWWGWLLIGASLIWMSFLAVVALTFGALRAVVGVARWSLFSRGGAEVSVAASRWAGSQVRHLDVSMNGLARAA